MVASWITLVLQPPSRGMDEVVIRTLSVLGFPHPVIISLGSLSVASFPLSTLVNGDRIHQKMGNRHLLKSVLIKEVFPFTPQPARLVGRKQNQIQILHPNLPTKPQESCSPTPTTILLLWNLEALNQHFSITISHGISQDFSQDFSSTVDI